MVFMRLRVVAADEMIGFFFDKSWSLMGTALGGDGASGVEGATRWGICRRWYVSFEEYSFFF